MPKNPRNWSLYRGVAKKAGAEIYVAKVHGRPAANLDQEQPADWYPDPRGEARLRYWSGKEWTDHTAP